MTQNLKYYWKLFLVNLEVTKVLIGFNVLLFIITSVLSLFFGNTTALILLGANSLVLVSQGEFWRLLTSAFLHGNIAHLLVNMYSLWTLGIFIEKFFGRKKLAITYIFGAILASLLSVAFQLLLTVSTAYTRSAFLTPDFSPQFTTSVGASGAIFAMLGLLLGNVVLNKRYSYGLPLDRNQLLFIMILNLGFGFMVSGIDNAAHIGGLIAGFLLALVLDPIATLYDSNLKKTFVKIAFGLGIIFVVLAFIFQFFSSLFTVFLIL